MSNSKLMMSSLALCLSAATAYAGGSLDFRGAPVTVHSGDSASWMNPFADWPSSHPLSGDFAVPSATSPVDVATSRDATNFKLKFTIPDTTNVRTIQSPDPEDDPPTTNNDLVVGDKVIVQLDPNGSRSAALENAGGIGSDYRYEIVIKHNAIVSQRRVTPGGAGTWLTGEDMTTVPNIGSATMVLAGASYEVTLTIPLSSVGLGTITAATKDPGLAIMVVNDLGHSHKVAGVTKRDLTAVTFPFGDMPASNTAFLDPGVLDATTAGGPWIAPNHWGSALLNTPALGATSLSFSHSPSPWFSDSIRLSFCNIGRFEDVGAADNSGNQASIPGWYKYERDAPCKEGIWLRATNVTTSPATARLVAVWGDAGLSVKNWRLIALSAPINFTPGQSTARIVWDQVPAKGSGLPGGSTHPCLRVYLIKANLNATELGLINAITDGTTLNAFESGLGIAPNIGSLQVAQMNFTNVGTGTCSNALCTQPVVGKNVDIEKMLYAALGIQSAEAQDTDDGPGHEPPIDATPFDPEHKPQGEVERKPWFGVTVSGFAVPTTAPTAPYVFIEAVGGVSWGVPFDQVASEPLTLGFNITNPALLYRDFTETPAKEVASGKRLILLDVAVKAPAGMEVPKVTLTGADSELEPGATVQGTVVVQQTQGGSDLPGWLECLLSGNIFCWIIVIIIIIIIVVVFIRRRSGP